MYACSNSQQQKTNKPWVRSLRPRILSFSSAGSNWRNIGLDGLWFKFFLRQDLTLCNTSVSLGMSEYTVVCSVVIYFILSMLLSCYYPWKSTTPVVTKSAKYRTTRISNSTGSAQLATTIISDKLMCQQV